MILHGYWRSGASYRVRIGLGLKGLAYQTAALDLRKGEQKAPAFLAINPQGMTPALQQVAALIGCDIHPLNNLRVLTALRQEFGADQATVDAWAGRWITPGFDALEVLVARHGAGWSFGDRPGLADCYLIPQLYSARRFNLALTPWPRLLAVEAAAQAHPAFQAAHPDRQPDADG